MNQPAPFLTAEWRDLAMLNYEVAPAVLAPFVPSRTEVDQWSGRTFVSVVGFRFLRTRVLGVGIPGHRDFAELNLRFYVRHRAAAGWRRGVVFVKEVVPRRAIAWLARAVYNENYVALPMRHAITAAGQGASSTRRATYEWLYARRWQRLSLEVRADSSVPAEDSEEAFITEHYWGYARQRDGGTVEYQVEHPRWRIWRAAEATLDCDVAGFYGPAFASVLAGPPSSAFLATGSRVAVHRGRRL